VVLVPTLYRTLGFMTAKPQRRRRGSTRRSKIDNHLSNLLISIARGEVGVCCTEEQASRQRVRPVCMGMKDCDIGRATELIDWIRTPEYRKKMHDKMELSAILRNNDGA
jgi:hypothetical protein